MNWGRPGGPCPCIRALIFPRLASQWVTVRGFGLTHFQVALGAQIGKIYTEVCFKSSEEFKGPRCPARVEEVAQQRRNKVVDLQIWQEDGAVGSELVPWLESAGISMGRDDQPSRKTLSTLWRKALSTSGSGRGSNFLTSYSGPASTLSKSSCEWIMALTTVDTYASSQRFWLTLVLLVAVRCQAIVWLKLQATYVFPPMST